MAISAFPAALLPIIQSNFLERKFQDALRSKLVYREVADREDFPIGIGETQIKTRAGLKAPVTTPLVASTNTNFDNGVTPSSFTVEQFAMTINQYGDAIDLNTVTNRVGIVNQYIHNGVVNAVQAAQTLDRLARDALFSAALAGNTFVKATLGAPATAVTVDDVRGFQQVPFNGQMVNVSASRTLSVVVGATPLICA